MKSAPPGDAYLGAHSRSRGHYPTLACCVASTRKTEYLMRVMVAGVALLARGACERIANWSKENTAERAA